jgi:hypothetical protein
MIISVFYFTSMSIFTFASLASMKLGALNLDWDICLNIKGIHR